MSIGRELKRRGKAAIPPLIFLSLVAYFLWNATQGEHGLQAFAARQQDFKAAQADLARADNELAAWERRVVALRSSRLDTDVLDERARAMLNLSEPTDIIVPYGPGKKVF